MSNDGSSEDDTERGRGVTDDEMVRRFAALLELTGSGRHHRRPAEDGAGLRPLVGLTHRLERLDGPAARPQFREALHARLMAAFDEQVATDRAVDETIIPTPRTVLPPRPRRGDDEVATRPADAARFQDGPTQVVRVVRPRRSGRPGLVVGSPGRRTRLAVLIGLTAGALAVSGVSVASTGAMPGDALYSVKRSGEQARLFIAGSDADRGRLHLDFARIRLVEARQVAPAAVAGVLAEMDREIVAGVRLLFTAGMQDADLAPIDSVAAFVQQHRAELTRLRAEVRAPGDPARQSLDLLTEIEIRVNELRAAIADACTTATSDRFGPKPAC